MSSKILSALPGETIKAVERKIRKSKPADPKSGDRSMNGDSVSKELGGMMAAAPEED